MWTVDKDLNVKVIFAAMNTAWVVVKIRSEKNLGLYGIWPTELTSQLALVPNKPVKWWINDCENHICELQIKTWIKVIFAVMNTTWAVVKIRPEKRKKNRYRRGHAFKSRVVQAWKFFQVLFSTLLRKCLLLWRSASYSHQISCNQFIIMVIGPTGVQFGL